MRLSLRYAGGKAKVAKKLLQLMPPKEKYDVYVEVFGGMAGLLLAKEPSNNEVYNDINSDLVNLFRVLRDREKAKELQRFLSLLPYSREEFNHAQTILQNPLQDPNGDVERAAWFLYVIYTSHGGGGKHFGITVKPKNSRRYNRQTVAYLNLINKIPLLCKRLRHVIIEHDDFRNILKRYDRSYTFFYLDPPYVPFTISNTFYKHNLTVKDHEELVDILLNIKGMVMLSGHRNPIYEKLEKNGWRRYDYGVYVPITSTRQNVQPRRIESVWLNYEPPQVPDWVINK